MDPFTPITIQNNLYLGLQATIIPYGASITHLFVSDKLGIRRDVVLGHDNPHQYRDSLTHPYFGAVIGRYANRIGNARFILNEFVYHTPANENHVNTLHGGDVGYDRRVWTIKNQEKDSVTFTLQDGDLVESFPGNLNVELTYTLTNNNELKIHYHATTDSQTVVNLTQHSYFNLNGFSDGKKDILEHVVTIDADKYTPNNESFVPTGKIEPVTKELDFTKPKPIGQDLAKIKAEPVGYDHNYVLNKNTLDHPSATVFDPHTGLKMEIYTTQPGIQFYTGNFLDGSINGKKTHLDVAYGKHAGFCFEAQHFPDSVNQPSFPTTVLKKDQSYDHTTIYKFINMEYLEHQNPHV